MELNAKGIEKVGRESIIRGLDLNLVLDLIEELSEKDFK